jgi:Domain of unknown function (DUF5658)
MVHRRGSERTGFILVADSVDTRSHAAHGAKVSPCEARFDEGRRCERERRAGIGRCDEGERRERRERRGGADRRTRIVHSLIAGNFNPRRRGPRRALDHGIAATDWHQPQWLAVALLIVLLSIADAVLTLTLLQHSGVFEANPIMAALVKGDWGIFVAIKIGLTAAGVVLLTAVVRIRAFGRVPVGALLCGLLVAYVGLVSYEVWLLQSVAAS